MSHENKGADQGRILIVEDDKEMCRFLAELLTEEDYHFEIAHDGPSALDRYKQNGFDPIITDLMMPRMKGTELASQLRAADPDATGLLITAFGSIESAIEAMCRRLSLSHEAIPHRGDSHQRAPRA
jgi:DNA-binding NtrC family response regulator